jgi:hypothetical protein
MSVKHKEFIVFEACWRPLRLYVALCAVTFALLMNKIYRGFVASLATSSCFFF